MASLTFYGGVNEIGGNKILLEDNGARVYLDFGQPFEGNNCEMLFKPARGGKAGSARKRN